MAIRKYSINFNLESRKGKTENVPIYMSVTFKPNLNPNSKSERLWFYTGYRCDRNLRIWDENTQRMKNNTINKQGISATIINSRLIELENTVNNIFVDYAKEPISIEFLSNEIKTRLGENKNPIKELNFWDYFESYVTGAKVSEGRRRHLKSTKKQFMDFELKKAEKIKGFSITYDAVNKELLDEFEKFLYTEKERTVKKKSEDTPVSNKLKPRSKNTVSGIMSRLKAFFSYSIDNKWIIENPFQEFKIEQQKYGVPIYLTKEERDLLYSAELKSERLERVRDLFILQCFLGCRFGDFVKLKKTNIINGSIQYIPHKGQEEKPEPVQVPLSEKAWTIIKKYDYPGGKLAPFISDQKYNKYLKDVFKEVELNRSVVRLNPVTRENEIVPLYEVASSHMARRTFIGLLHKTVKNEVIASMSGHVENSKAFSRYYKIDEESKKDAIKTIE